MCCVVFSEYRYVLCSPNVILSIFRYVLCCGLRMSFSFRISDQNFKHFSSFPFVKITNKCTVPFHVMNVYGEVVV